MRDGDAAPSRSPDSGEIAGVLGALHPPLGPPVSTVSKSHGLPASPRPGNTPLPDGALSLEELDRCIAKAVAVENFAEAQDYLELKERAELTGWTLPKPQCGWWLPEGMKKWNCIDDRVNRPARRAQKVLAVQQQRRKHVQRERRQVAQLKLSIQKLSDKKIYLKAKMREYARHMEFKAAANVKQDIMLVSEQIRQEQNELKHREQALRSKATHENITSTVTMPTTDGALDDSADSGIIAYERAFAFVLQQSYNLTEFSAAAEHKKPEAVDTLTPSQFEDMLGLLGQNNLQGQFNAQEVLDEIRHFVDKDGDGMLSWTEVKTSFLQSRGSDCGKGAKWIFRSLGDEREDPITPQQLWQYMRDSQLGPSINLTLARAMVTEARDLCRHLEDNSVVSTSKEPSVLERLGSTGSVDRCTLSCTEFVLTVQFCTEYSEIFQTTAALWQLIKGQADVTGRLQRLRKMAQTPLSISPETATNNFERSRLIVKAMRCILRPNATWRTPWTLMQLLLLIWVAIEMPFRFGFSVCANLDYNWPLFMIDVLVDTFFLIDICMNFLIANTDDEGILLLSRKTNACMYLKGWFSVDLLGSIPVSYLELMKELNIITRSTNVQDFGSINKVLRFFRLAKLLRILRMGRVINALQNSSDQRWIRQLMTSVGAGAALLKYVFLAWYLGHILACTWHAVGELRTCEIDLPVCPLADNVTEGCCPADKTLDGWVVRCNWSVAQIKNETNCAIATQLRVDRAPLTVRYMTSFFLAFSGESVAESVNGTLWEQMLVTLQVCVIQVRDFHHTPTYLSESIFYLLLMIIFACVLRYTGYGVRCFSVTSLVPLRA